MKKLFILLLPLMAIAATVALVPISNFPNTATLQDTDLFVVASGTTNKQITWPQLRLLMTNASALNQAMIAAGTNGITAETNASLVTINFDGSGVINYATNAGGSDFATNLPAGAMIAGNLAVSNNIASSVGFSLDSTTFFMIRNTGGGDPGSFIFGGTGGDPDMIGNGANLTNIPVAGLSDAGSLAYSNDVSRVLTPTNSWAGPTNNLPMNLHDQYYITYTPCSITNLSSFSSNTIGPVELTISNASTTNITLYLPHAGMIPERTAGVTISNASEGILAVRYRPQSKTNAVFRLF